jgi:hypothetical protein
MDRRRRHRATPAGGDPDRDGAPVSPIEVGDGSPVYDHVGRGPWSPGGGRPDRSDPEFCDDSVESRYWPLDDVSRAADILIETLEDESERARMARAAHERFRQEFDADVIVPRLTAFLTERFHQVATAGQ